MSEFEDLQARCWTISREKGFKPGSFSETVALIHSEISEAFEEYRTGHAMNEVYYSEDAQGLHKPEGVPVEIADVVIRIMDWSYRWNIPLEAIIEEKMAYNARRPYKHGKRF